MSIQRLALSVLWFAAIPLLADEIPSGTKIVIRTSGW